MNVEVALMMEPGVPLSPTAEGIAAGLVANGIYIASQPGNNGDELMWEIIAPGNKISIMSLEHFDPIDNWAACLRRQLSLFAWK
jgi:hypothetical protein